MTTDDWRTDRIVFSGHVQGVGFRYQVRSLARRHPLAGFVRNLPDGTVELVASGPLEAIDSLLSDVTGHFQGHITHIERQPFEAGELGSRFEIRF